MRSHFRDARAALVEGDARERGVVLAFLAMVLFTLIVMAGLAVDVGNWWWTGQKVQKAADAAAMAGVTYLPDNFATAQTTAGDIAKRNGYDGAANATVVSAVDDRPTELRVTITTQVDNFFTGILGFKKTTIKRTAVADYAGAVPMGSPADYLGQDPEVAGRLQNLWLNVSGRGSTKESGDRYTSYQCGTSYYGCSGSGTNTEYLFDSAGTTNNGYRFVVSVDAPTSDPLQIQVYDPAFIFTGDRCDAGQWRPAPNNDNGGPPIMPTAAQLTTLQSTYSNVAPYGTFFNDATTRYAPGGNNFCPGDQKINGRADIRTGYILRAPDETPWTDLDNPVVCAVDFRPINAESNGGLFQYLDPANASYNTTDGAYVRTNFHRWATVCSVPSGNVEAGDYILQIRTNYTGTDPLATSLTTTTGGHNRYSLRAGFGTSGVPVGTGVKLYANGKLPIYVNANATSTPSFYLARILPTAAGRTLMLEFFDIGDVGSATNQTVSMQVKPPSDVGSPTNFTNCKFQRDNDVAQTSSTCTLSGMNSNAYQGRLVRVTIPIPSTYTCNDASSTGCWLKINMTFTTAAIPNDTTTWSASIDGDPIRLVE